MIEFQPFLRFWEPLVMWPRPRRLTKVSTLLEILAKVIEEILSVRNELYVSTLLEILVGVAVNKVHVLICGFQPFLRFWAEALIDTAQRNESTVSTLLEILATTRRRVNLSRDSCAFQPFLRFWQPEEGLESSWDRVQFQPFLRFWTSSLCARPGSTLNLFQPFLRFW